MEMNKQTKNILQNNFSSPLQQDIKIPQTKNINIEKISQINDFSEKDDISVNKSIQSQIKPEEEEKTKKK